MLGMVAEKLPNAMPHYKSILDLLSPLIADDNDGFCRDNAIASVTRMVVAHEDLLPTAEIVPKLMLCLPLKNDMEENSTVCHFIG